MRTEKLTKCLYHISYGGRGCACKTDLSPPPPPPPPSNSLLTIPRWCSDVVSVACFGVRVSVMFHLTFVHYTFSSVWAAEWPPFKK